MKLTNDNLLDVFSMWDTGHPNTKKRIPFDFVNRKQKKLLVCIGDSWTYGSDIGIDNNDDDYRLANIFGSCINKK